MQKAKEIHPELSNFLLIQNFDIRLGKDLAELKRRKTPSFTES